MGTAIVAPPALQSLVREGSPWLVQLISEIETADQEFALQAQTWIEQVGQIAVEDQDTYEVMATLATELVRIDKAIVGYHEPFKKGADALHKMMVAFEKKVLGPIQQGSALAKRKITNWTIEQERLRAEQERLARERSEQQSRDLQLAAAVEMERLGGTPEEVAAVLEAPAPLPVPVVQPAYTKASNVATTTRWRAEITSIKELCAAIGRGDQPETFAMGIEKYEKPGTMWISSPTLNKMAQAMTTTMNIPGVKAVKESGVSVRTS